MRKFIVGVVAKSGHRLRVPVSANTVIDAIASVARSEGVQEVVYAVPEGFSSVRETMNAELVEKV